MNIKEISLARVTVPGTWKLWKANGEGVLECIAICKDQHDAYSLRQVYIDGNEDVVVTRHSTVAMEVEDN